MPRWKQPTARERERIEKRAWAEVRERIAAQVGSSRVEAAIRPEDRHGLLIGTTDLVAQAEELGLSQSAAYAVAAKIRRASDWPLVIDGQPVTCVSSASYYVGVQQHVEAQERRRAAGREAGRKGGRPRKVEIIAGTIVPAED